MDDGRILRVVVVDDNRDAADTLATLIKLWGHVVEIAYDGVTALACNCPREAQHRFA